MEVYLNNLPATLTEDALIKELMPYLNALGIADWMVDKPRRHQYAFLTFLNAADGSSFLSRHGKRVVPPSAGPVQQQQQKHKQQKHKQQKSPASGARPPQHTKPDALANLHILATPIYAEKSKKSPKTLALGQLRHARDTRQVVLERRPNHDPEASCRITAISCGKMMLEDTTFGLTFSQQTQLRDSGFAKFGRQSLVVQFDKGRMDIPSVTIEHVVASHPEQTITLVLSEPPRFYCRKPVVGKWERHTSWLLWPDLEKYAAHCLVYQLHPSSEYYSTVKVLKDILPTSQQPVAVNLHPAPVISDYTTALHAFDGIIHAHDRRTRVGVPFPILFQVQALVWNNYLHPYSAIHVLELLEHMAREPTSKGKLPLTVSSMRILFQRIPYPIPGVDPSQLDPVYFMDSVREVERELCQSDGYTADVYGSSLPRHQTWVFKAQVTPTRITLQGPEAESKNRVLRMFPDHVDHFLRVCFCDENGQDLVYNPRVDNELVFARYRRVLKDGIHIAGRQFSFLGFSHSSLRSHSTWFMAPFLDADFQRQDHDTILKSLGDFEDIRIPAKCAARIGQAFSETPYAVDLFKAGIHTHYIPDVKSADGSRVFSDGIGTISWDALEEVWESLPMRSTAPTCLQIRYGGFKGMLALDSRLRGKAICVRKESMMKFPSQDLRELGICDVASRPLRLVLNRQVIKILEDMGTEDRWFVALQTKALKALRAVTATAANTGTFLQYQDVGTALGLPSFIKQLDKMGIDYRKDSFLKSVVEHVVLRELRLLKYKARIPVDKGVTLFGVMDETGFLRENEVYVTFDKGHAKSGARMDSTLSDGPVIVTRCPALHPGDVQYVNMVTPPSSHPLRDLRNCIVFSQKGSRDLPSQLSGGDLDGDLYNVIWDVHATPSRTFPPADYPRVSPPVLDRPVTRDDIATFFINFMKSDILGLIANRHQILADVKELGTSDIDCIRLAKMHSTAVDYSKTGIAVSLQEMPKGPRSRPDFLAPAPPIKVYNLGEIGHTADLFDDDDNDDDGMGRAKHIFHRSEKILGHLYRGIDEKKIWAEDIHRTVSTDGPSVWVQLMGRVRAELDSHHISTEYKRLSQQAWKLRNLYEDHVSQSRIHYSDNPRAPITEAEVFCGSVLNKRGVQTRQQRDASTRLKEDTERSMTWISKLMREQPANGDDDDDAHYGIRMSWACLVVGCVNEAEDADDSYRGTGELVGFRVVAATCLLKELNILRAAHPERKAAGLADIESLRKDFARGALDATAADEMLHLELLMKKLEGMGVTLDPPPR